MKVLTKIEEVSNEGLMSLIGQRVTFYCMNYIYTGDLNGVNETQVKLDNPAIVYDTGSYTEKTWKDAQKLPNSIYIRLSSVEMYSVLK